MPGAIVGFEEVEVNIPGQEKLHRCYRVYISADMMVSLLMLM
jgi:hypothetical protein